MLSNAAIAYFILNYVSLCQKGVQKEDEGMYMCTVSNQFGKQELSAFITVTGIGNRRDYY